MTKLMTEIKSLEDHLLVLATGEYDLDEALKGFTLVLGACKITGHTRVLVDFSCMEGIPRASEKVVYALGAAQHYEDHLKTGGQDLTIAYLGAATALNSYEPGLDIVQQRNLPIRLFHSREDACHWLKIEPPGRSGAPHPTCTHVNREPDYPPGDPDRP